MKKLKKQLQKLILLVTSVLSGNRNFEGRIHPLVKANYLASPPLVVAYALAGTVDIDLQKKQSVKIKMAMMYSSKIFGHQQKKLMLLLKKQLHQNYSVKNMKLYSMITNVGMKFKQAMSHYTLGMRIQLILQNPPFFEGLINRTRNS